MPYQILMPVLATLVVLGSFAELPAQESEAGVQPVPKSAVETGKEGTEKAKQEAAKKWTPLLAKEGLDGWEVTDFGNQGEVKRAGELLVLEMGDPLTGITSKLKDFPTTDFEIEFEAQRTEGNDFLCGLTFPVGDGFCTFVAGGWGGGIVGLSSVDGMDASENGTTTYHAFDNNKWYKFRARVEPDYVRCWINDKQTFYQEREGCEFSTRIEVYACQPLGLCAFQSRVEIKNLRWRKLTKADIEASEGDSSESK